MNKIVYEVEINTDRESLRRIQELLEHNYNILKTLQDDSFKGIEGGASPHYKVRIELKEEWI